MAPLPDTPMSAVRVTVVLVCTIVLVTGTITHDQHMDMHREETFANRVMLTDVLFSGEHVSLSVCASACLLHGQCLSFFHSTDDVKCQTHSTMFSNVSMTTYHQHMEYYTLNNGHIGDTFLYC